MIKWILILFFLGACSHGKYEGISDTSVKGATAEDIDEHTEKKFQPVELAPKEVIVEKKVAPSNKKIVAAPKIVAVPKAMAPVIEKEKATPAPTPASVEVKKEKKKKIKELMPLTEKDFALWKVFDPSSVKVGENIILDVTYMGVSTAQMSMVVKPMVNMGGREAYYFYGRAKTAAFYKWVYSIDDVVESYVDKELFTSLKYSIAQREKNKTIDHVELNDRDSLITHYRFKRIKEGNVRKKSEDNPIPKLSHDLFSSYYFIKGLPLKNGDEYAFPVTSKGETWMLKVSVLKREVIKSAIGDFNSIRMKVVTNYDGEVAKRGEFTYWLSDDAKRIFMGFQAEMKIGSIKGDVIFYEVDGEKLEAK